MSSNVLKWMGNVCKFSCTRVHLPWRARGRQRRLWALLSGTGCPNDVHHLWSSAGSWCPPSQPGFTGYMARKEQSQDLNPCVCFPKPGFLSSQVTNSRNSSILHDHILTFLISLHKFESPVLTGKEIKRNPNWKRSETVNVCRWHDTIRGKSYRHYQKTTRLYQWIQ